MLKLGRCSAITQVDYTLVVLDFTNLEKPYGYKMAPIWC